VHLAACVHHAHMNILGIETSCDETAAAVVTDGVQVRSSVIATSRAAFLHMGGVIPEDAARRQLSCIVPVIRSALDQASMRIEDIEALAVTFGPGLFGSLIVGTSAARTLASIFEKPLIHVHHTLGHLTSTWLQADPVPVFPCITLSASGGHTDLWLRTSHTRGTLLGRTRDDAAGEAFDKGASLLGLPYPGGPSVAKAAENGNPRAYDFPIPLKGEPCFDFSFSGLKTALRYALRDMGELSPAALTDMAASYQYAICAQLTDRIVRAVDQYSECKEVHVVGGVSANTFLRSMLKSALSIPMRAPATLSYCTDNAAMIAAAGYFLWKEDHERALTSQPTQAAIPLEFAVS